MTPLEVTSFGTNLLLGAAKPLSAYQMAVVTNGLTSGINWKGCGKKEQAEGILACLFTGRTYGGKLTPDLTMLLTAEIVVFKLTPILSRLHEAHTR